jgi:hypothetical protein
MLELDGERTMRVCDKNLIYLPHLHLALLYAMLCGFATIEKPDITVQPQRKRGVVAG